MLEKSPDCFFGCAIKWDPITGVIKLDQGRYLREIVAKYDMTDIHSCSNKMVELCPIGTRSEVADIGTKSLAEPAFVMLRNVLLGLTTFSELQGM